jgi:hypothetical protein
VDGNERERSALVSRRAVLSEMEGRPELGVTSGQTGCGQRLWMVSVVAEEAAASDARMRRTTARSLAMATIFVRD